MGRGELCVESESEVGPAGDSLRPQQTNMHQEGQRAL